MPSFASWNLSEQVALIKQMSPDLETPYGVTPSGQSQARSSPNSDSASSFEIADSFVEKPNVKVQPTFTGPADSGGAASSSSYAACRA